MSRIFQELHIHFVLSHFKGWRVCEGGFLILSTRACACTRAHTHTWTSVTLCPVNAQDGLQECESFLDGMTGQFFFPLSPLSTHCCFQALFCLLAPPSRSLWGFGFGCQSATAPQDLDSTPFEEAMAAVP